MDGLWRELVSRSAVLRLAHARKIDNVETTIEQIETPSGDCLKKELNAVLEFDLADFKKLSHTYRDSTRSALLNSLASSIEMAILDMDNHQASSEAERNMWFGQGDGVIFYTGDMFLDIGITRYPTYQLRPESGATSISVIVDKRSILIFNPDVRFTSEPSPHGDSHRMMASFRGYIGCHHKMFLDRGIRE